MDEKSGESTEEEVIGAGTGESGATGMTMTKRYRKLFSIPCRVKVKHNERSAQLFFSELLGFWF